jgi:DNA-binding transcriptional MerR regulator
MTIPRRNVMENLTIGKLARQANVGVETLRYYERRGLIEPLRRTDAGYRLYDDDARRRLQFIRRAHLAQAKIDDIEARIRDLERMKTALSVLEDQCPGHAGTTAQCPILAALNQSGTELSEGGAQ